MTGKQTPDIDQKLYAILNRIGEMYPADSSDIRYAIGEVKTLFEDCPKWEEVNIAYDEQGIPYPARKQVL